jgi:glycogen debranching enzyme
MLKRYFTELDNKEESKLANNGWIGNAKPFEDFAMHGWHYLKRDINIWEDSVKLRYGSCPSDSQFLWDHMSEYVSRMA